MTKKKVSVPKQRVKRHPGQKRNLAKEKNLVFQQLALVAAVAALAFALSLMVGLLFSQQMGQIGVNSAVSLRTQLDNREVIPQDRRSEAAGSLPQGSSVPGAPVQQAEVPSASINRQSPASGPAESVILAASVVLGIIGTGTVIAIKRGI